MQTIGNRRVLPVLCATLSVATAAALWAFPASATPTCQLANGITHVVHITFDNVHYRRDIASVPSDLEQMPSLLNYLTQNGTLGTNHHTPLISHTATDILTALTGVYGDRMGVPVANSYRVFDALGNPSSSHPSFVYWTAVDATDGKPVMVNENGKTAPAPWVAFTRAGCDVGAYSVANMEFETLPGDVTTVFGSGSAPDVSVRALLASTSAATRQRANTDWLGVAIHCAEGSARCASGSPDALPDEPGGYVGYQALYGNANVQPAISATPIRDLDGNVITDAYGHPGFPNIFSPTASQALGYVATLLEAGVPVVYTYIADAHDNRSGPGTFGPGEAGYVAQLKAYDTAFGKFFARLSAEGIDASNTLFIVTADEGDHFVGGVPSNPGCDGVTVPCQYIDPRTGLRDVGELTANLDSILFTERGNTMPFLVHADDAPTLYVAGNPVATSVETRTLEHDLAALTWVNPLWGKNSQVDLLSPYLGDRATMQFLHMVTNSPARTPTVTIFGNPDYFFQTTKGSLPLAPQDCSANSALCVAQNPNFAWNHGDVQTDIVTTFLGIAGPGVRRTGVENRVWSDHTDVRPTMLALLGLKDDYVHDGRALVEKIQPAALNHTVREHRESLIELGRRYKQLNAPLGALAKLTLSRATRAVRSDDATYGSWLAHLADLTIRRDATAADMKAILNGAVFNGSYDERQTEDQGERFERELSDESARRDWKREDE
jgi:hypothetical protein